MKDFKIYVHYRATDNFGTMIEDYLTLKETATDSETAVSYALREFKDRSKRYLKRDPSAKSVTIIRAAVVEVEYHSQVYLCDQCNFRASTGKWSKLFKNVDEGGYYRHVLWLCDDCSNGPMMENGYRLEAVVDRDPPSLIGGYVE